MHDIYEPAAPYVASLEPIGKVDLERIRCHCYVNLGIAESDLALFDDMFMKLRGKPQCYSVANRGNYTFYVPFQGEEVFVDWRIYCTWSNTFHLRYEEGLVALGLNHSNPHIHPTNQFMLANWMRRFEKSPKPLAECDFAEYARAG